MWFTLTGAVSRQKRRYEVQVLENKRVIKMGVFQSTQSKKPIRSNDFLITPIFTPIGGTKMCAPHRGLGQTATARTP